MYVIDYCFMADRFNSEASHVEAYLNRVPVLFPVLFSITITSLRDERAGLYAVRAFLLFCTYYILSSFSSS